MQNSTHDSILSDSVALERHLAAHPASPLFTRLAASHLAADRPAQALKVCLQGMRYHPEYASALLLITRAQVMLRQYSDARQSLRDLQRIQPVCPAAEALRERMTELELEYPPYTAVAGSAFARTPVERPGKGEEKWSRKDDILPGFELPRHAAEETADETVPDTPPPMSGLDLAGLASRLETARIPALPEEEESTEQEDALGVEEVNLEVRPVTETLVSIYVQQGKLREAIDGYRRLAARYEDRRDEFESIIRKLESRLASEESRQ
jgi:tetratricopeptide (TPR) repeat protein